ncbi:MAG: hypothetical protein Q8K59_01955 [Nitrosomonas sp.]|nr:hypothetical protein [Nitrosomonas sp.]MDP1949860.1 hypothetical protein [Nitrosomonas sp.]
MVTKRGKQASRKAAARKYGFLEVPLTLLRPHHLNPGTTLNHRIVIKC